VRGPGRLRGAALVVAELRDLSFVTRKVTVCCGGKE